MFTGIIRETGKVSKTLAKRQSLTLFIACKKLRKGLKTGDSIAVNGVCLTAEKLFKTGFQATAVKETLTRTTLGKTSQGEMVNLERPLRLSDGLDGHLVQGHVDGVAKIGNDKKQGASTFREFLVDRKNARYIVEKGSVAIDGISLTVAKKNGRGFWVALIPETLKRTTQGQKKKGDLVNIETDILAKYAETLLKGSKT